ncbi:uncharacterized protein [Dysidea avara]|uniref:uncharacterized protein isoform X5 n=1 Tax=Dysidea avara TaxID=196820 RepID=UPI003327627C
MASQESTAQIGIDVNLTKIFLRKSLESLSLVEVEADRYFICRLLLRKPSQPSCCGHQSCHSCIDGKYRLGVWVIIFCKVTRGRSVDNRVAARAVIPKGYPGDHSVDDTPIVTGAPGTDIVVNGKKCLNLETFNFLGFAHFAGNQ